MCHAEELCSKPQAQPAPPRAEDPPSGRCRRRGPRKCPCASQCQRTCRHRPQLARGGTCAVARAGHWHGAWLRLVPPAPPRICWPCPERTLSLQEPPACTPGGLPRRAAKSTTTARLQREGTHVNHHVCGSGGLVRGLAGDGVGGHHILQINNHWGALTRKVGT